MIDIQVYRFRIGLYKHKSFRRKGGKGKGFKNKGKFINPQNQSPNTSTIILAFMYIYFIIMAYCVMASIIIISSNSTSFSKLGYLLPSIKLYQSYTALFANIFLVSLVNISNRRHFKLFSYFIKPCWSNSCCAIYNNKRILRFLYLVISWTFIINLTLIVIVNPSVVNPGPVPSPKNTGRSNCISVAYQNVQGLIPFSELANRNPRLDQTKIIELNTFLTLEKPSVLVLNETWLKSSINDEEIIEGNNYKIFRLDRTNKSHPLDPMNPSKFRKYGGGVLIAIRNDVEISSTKISFKCAAEILGITLTLKNNKKIVLCTCYRVANLGLKIILSSKIIYIKLKLKRYIEYCCYW